MFSILMLVQGKMGLLNLPFLINKRFVSSLVEDLGTEFEIEIERRCY